MSFLWRIVTSPCKTAYEGTECVTPAGVPVVMPTHAAHSLDSCLRADGHPAPRVSRIGHYLRPYCGQDLNGRSLLAWRGCGVGDQIVFAGCLAYLARRYPQARIALLCDPRIGGALWAGATNLPFDVLAEPLPLDQWNAYNYHWICEGTCDGDHEPDQPDIWSGHLRSIGHDDAPDSARIPLIPESAATSERARLWAWSLPGSGHVILWQLAASARIRSLPPFVTAPTLQLLSERRPDLRVVAVGTPPQIEEYTEACQSPNVVATTGDLTLQELLVLPRFASALVCPDSCLGHASAACGTPTVSLWCPFPAGARVATYPNHRPLERRGECSPCWCHERSALTGERREGCPREPAGADSGRWCKGLSTIRPEEIVAKIEEIV